MAGGGRKAIDPNFFKIVEFLEILGFSQKIFRLLLLVKIKVLNFIRNSLSLASLLNWSVVEIEIFSGGGGQDI